MPDKKTDKQTRKQLVEGEDFYFENNLMVLTAKYLRERKYCCGNNCRHCPYTEKSNFQSK